MEVKDENAEICNVIHDSFILVCDNDPDIYKSVANNLAECMQRAWFEMSKLTHIKDLPMPIDVSVGYNWGDIENDDIKNLYDLQLDPYKTYWKAK